MDKDLLDLVTRASVTLGSIGIERETPRHYGDMLALFDRTRSMFGAVRLLLANRFTHEATLLVRPLFTESLTLEEFAASDEQRRGGLAVGWELASLASVRGILLHRQSRGEDVSKLLSNLAERERNRRTYAAENGFASKQWQPDDYAKGLANKHGRGDEYAAMLFAQHFVHGSTLATGARYSRTEDGIAIGGLAADLDTFADDTALFAMKSALLAGRAICSILEIEEPDEIQPLLEEVERRASAEN